MLVLQAMEAWQQKNGGFDACKLNVPTTVGVANYRSVYIGTLTEGNTETYYSNKLRQKKEHWQCCLIANLISRFDFL